MGGGGRERHPSSMPVFVTYPPPRRLPCRGGGAQHLVSIPGKPEAPYIHMHTWLCTVSTYVLRHDTCIHTSERTYIDVSALTWIHTRIHTYRHTCVDWVNPPKLGPKPEDLDWGLSKEVGGAREVYSASKETDIQRGRHTYRLTYRHAKIQTYREVGIPTYGRTDIQAHSRHVAFISWQVQR